MFPHHNNITSTNNLAHKTQCFHRTTQATHNFFKQTTNSPNLLYKARLHAQKGGGGESNKLTTHQHISSLCFQQMTNRGKAVHDAIMGSPIDTAMEDSDDTVVLEANQTKRAQEPKCGSSSSKRKKSMEIITGLKDIPRDFWLGISAMENLAIDEGVKSKDCKPPSKKEDLIEMGITEGEAEEMCQIGKIAFPHVKQLLYPMERPDGKGGQHFNLTQLPLETEVDPGT